MNEVLIDEFCLGYYGFGELHSKYWFVGMEEGGETTAEDCKNDIEKWDKKPTSVIRDADIINTKAWEMFFSPEAKKIQKTWRGIIQLLLSIENKPMDREDILNFQKKELGRENGNNLLLELLPLPNRNTAKWTYSSYELPQFSSRIKYYRHYTPERIKRIKKLIAEYNPKVVVFYSKIYVKNWKAIIGIDENNEKDSSFIIKKDSWFIIKKNETIFVICNHPSCYNKKEYYPELGKEIRLRLNAK